MAKVPSDQALLLWYHSLFSRRVDLVGDYAGNELFLIDLDSLLLQCFSDPKINFDDGFQLLHAVYAVEKLLHDLVSRKCNFHIVCFDQNEDLCVPPSAAKKNRDKYILARWTIIRHLQRNLPEESEIKFCSFSSFTDPAFVSYLNATGVYFFMCHDGTDTSSPRSREDARRPLKDHPGSALQAIRKPESDMALTNELDSLTINSSKDQKCRFRAMISWFIGNQYNVALINELEMLDTKALTVVIEFSRLQDDHDFSGLYETAITNGKSAGTSYALDDIDKLDNLSERDIVTVLSIGNAIESDQISIEEAWCFLLHSSALQHLALENRRFLQQEGAVDVQHIISAFAQSSSLLLRDPEFQGELNDEELACDVIDLIDGLLLKTITNSKDFRQALLSNKPLNTKFEALCAAVSELCENDIVVKLETLKNIEIKTNQEATASTERAVLPFKNDVFDKHLAPIHLQVENNPDNQFFLGESRIFKELSHWHNHKKTIMYKGPPPVEDKKARRRTQFFLAEMQAYAASLTNAAGKLLDPESIIAGQKTQPVKAIPSAKQNGQAKADTSKPPAKGGKKSAGPPKKGGKAAALEAAAAIQAGRNQNKADVVVSAWKIKCKEIMSQGDPEVSYTLTRTHLNSLSSNDELAPEIELFMIHCLLQIWTESRKTKDGAAGLDIAGLIWDSYLRLSKVTTGMTPEVIAALESSAKVLGLPVMNFQPNSPSRPLSFIFVDLKQQKLKLKAIGVGDIAIPGGATNFQLEHCGPYFDRAIDSAPDARVPFHPDAWQRKVLDAIDADKSVFVVAPTSAGKTFISFYAMKKVLLASDDDVVVYVAPTKALVNQIAAEIQAGFSKSYKYAGRSVWGIHTRDYRVNNPTGCQVLVTVPHLLQIMLLAPSNAEKKSSWSNRIKRIIFDEVHCLGNADDGVIWEQLLLQAPCPIIALSATVGNPKEFSDWLISTQEANGNELVTVEHHHRYSDLRKYVYVPPKEFSFDGLPGYPLIYTPGLEAADAFAFVHPVASLVNRSRGMPSDLTLEARDCFRLYQCMKKHETKEYSLPSNLKPELALPAVIKKVDIFKWESELKAVLVKWMSDEKSPFDKVQQELSKGVETSTRNSLSTKKDATSKGEARKVDENSIVSTLLPALVDLHAQDALPGIVFNYDRKMCETLAKAVIDELEKKEDTWKANNSAWQKKIAEFEKWTKDQEAAKAHNKTAVKPIKKKGKRGDEDGDGDEKVSKTDRQRDAGGESSKWVDFDPQKPIDGFHFADIKKLATSEMVEYQRQLRYRGVPEWLVRALERGVGVHHAGMNRKYRQVTEILFRKGFLRVVVATGTLALGINMPCKTVVFAGDSVFLTALNFRQGAGRAGRRGFDVLGNVVFLGMPTAKVYRLLSSRLPDLNGHFPITTSLVLRMASLLHDTKNSQFAIQAINSIFSQPRLYLGSPNSKLAVLHHLRYSIEYLRRQSLLDVNGAPLNFAGCVSHLYYTENAAWSFHALLTSGYLHDLCREVETKPTRISETLMLVLAHVFARQPCKRSDEEFREEIKRTTSIVFLPPLPEGAYKALRAHNDETLETFHGYVKTYADQHLKDPDNKLPFTQQKIGGDSAIDLPNYVTLPPTVVRSPFVALSGHGDKFETISDLCSTVRSGVFLEESVIPYLAIYPDESDTPLNAYLYDFFKHGDIKTIHTANRIRESDVWFYLNDFSLVLATIITSLTNFMKTTPGGDVDMLDLVGSGDAFEEQQDDKAIDKGTGQKVENDEKDEEEGGDDWDGEKVDEKGLVNVLKAFTNVKTEFDEKFKRMWA